MDDRLDALARSLAAARSRRAALKQIGAALVGAAAAWAFPRGAGAATSCSDGMTLCRGLCVNTRFDPANCGACGRAVGPGAVCRNGTAVPTTGPGSPFFVPSPALAPVSPPGGAGAPSPAGGGQGNQQSSNCVESACFTCQNGVQTPRCDGFSTCCVPTNNINDACVALRGINAPGCPRCTACSGAICTPCAQLGQCCNGQGQCVARGATCTTIQNGACVSCADAGMCCNAQGQCVPKPSCTKACQTVDASCNCVDCTSGAAGNQCCDAAKNICVADCGDCRTCSGGTCVSCAAAGKCCFTSSGGTRVCTDQCPTGQTCVAGVCTCNAPLCNGVCCPAGTCCNGSTCLSTAQQGDSVCGTGGGACHACPAGQHCVNGTCQATCIPGSCNGCCSNGACVSTCPNGLCCSAGTCVQAAQCPGGCCSNGACGCPAGQTCLNGACCPNGQVCGNVCCSNGQGCQNGTCSCQQLGTSCNSDGDCCGGTNFSLGPNGCFGSGSVCSAFSQCCNFCKNGVCTAPTCFGGFIQGSSSGQCNSGTCSGVGGLCRTQADCCLGGNCSSGVCCGTKGADCSSQPNGCCSGLTCQPDPNNSTVSHCN